MSATGLVFFLYSVIMCRPCHIRLMFELLNLDSPSSILKFCLFDSLAEGIATLFVFNHVSSRLAMIKLGVLRFQFCMNAAINPRFWLGGKVLKVTERTKHLQCTS
jgi:hypothetical protein